MAGERARAGGDLLGRLFDHEPLGVALLDRRTGLVAYANNEFNRIAEGEAVGAALSAVLPWLDELVAPILAGSGASQARQSAPGTWSAPARGGGFVRFSVEPVSDDATLLIVVDANGEAPRPDLDAVQARIDSGVALVRRSTAKCSRECEREIHSLALESLRDAVIGVDSQERVVLWNAAASRLYGCSADQMMGRPLSEAFKQFWPDDFTQRRATDELVREGTWTGDIAQLTAEGRRLIVEATVSRVCSDSDAHGCAMIAVARDVGDRRRGERLADKELQDLKAEWRRLRTIIDNLPVAMIMTDAKGSPVECNEGLDRIWRGKPPEGMRREDAYRARWADTGQPVLRQERTYVRALESGQAVHGDVLEIERFDGTLGSVVSSAVPIVDSGGVVQGAVGVLEDITDERERMRFSEALNRINIMLHSSLSAEEAMPAVLDEACSALGVQLGAVALRADKAWRITQGCRLSEELIGATLTAEHLPLAEQAADTGTLAIGPTPLPYSTPPRDGDAQSARECASLAAPLVMRGEVFGALLLYASPTLSFSHRQREFAGQLAASVSFALANAALFDEQVETATLRALLSDIDSEMNALLDIELIVSRTLPRAMSAIAADSVTLFLRDDEGWYVECASGETPAESGREIPEEFLFPIAEVIERRAAVVADDTSDDGSSHAARTIGALVAAPMLHGDDVYGVLVFGRTSTVKPWTGGQIDFANRLGSHLSLAAENAALFAKEQERARTSEALARVDRIIHSSLEPEHVLQRALSEGAEALGAEAGSIAIRTGHDWVTRYVYGTGSDPVGYRFGDEMMPYLPEMRRLRGPVLIDVSKRDDVRNHLLEGQQVAFILAIPLFVREEHMGTLFFNRLSGGAFADFHLDFARQLGMSLSVALENARLYQGERHIAETLQETLLVLPRRVEGIDYSRLYRSATMSTRVGGDFIDVFPLPGGKVVFALGDVSGKGIEAAAVTATVRNTLRAYSVDGLSPAAVARKTNHVLTAFTDSETFVTAVFGVLDVSTGLLKYTSAGHPPAMIISPFGELEELAVGSPVMGAFPDVTFVEGEVRLKPGHCLLAYSDGVIEARGTQGLFGEERLMARLSALGSEPPKTVVSAVFSAIERFAERQLRDDVALLALCLAE